MAIIDSSYFVGELNVPNITGSNPVVAVNLAGLNRLITLYERLYLLKLLGETLYDEFIADLATSETWATGLRDELRDATNKISPIAYYVYYYWLRNAATYMTSGGEVEQKSENATQSSPALRMSEAYNQMVRLTVKVLAYINDESDSFPSPAITETGWLRNVNTFGI